MRPIGKSCEKCFRKIRKDLRRYGSSERCGGDAEEFRGDAEEFRGDAEEMPRSSEEFREVPRSVLEYVYIMICGVAALQVWPRIMVN